MGGGSSRHGSTIGGADGQGAPPATAQASHKDKLAAVGVSFPKLDGAHESKVAPPTSEEDTKSGQPPHAETTVAEADTPSKEDPTELKVSVKKRKRKVDMSRLASKVVVRNRAMRSFHTRRRSPSYRALMADRVSRSVPRMSPFARAKLWALHRGKVVVLQEPVSVEEQLSHNKKLIERQAQRPASPTCQAMPPTLVEKLKKHYLFATLPEDTLMNLVAIMSRREAVEGEYILRQGEITQEAIKDVARILSGADISKRTGRTDHRFYILEQGSLQITFNGVNCSEVNEPGECLGDVALLYDTHARTSAVVTSGKAVLWSLDRKDYQAVQVAAKINGIVKTLQTISALDPVPRDELPHFAMVVGEKKIPANTYVYTAGQTDERMYIIKSGEARVVVKASQKIVVTLQPGQWFGEEVFQQAVQIERRRSTMVTGELTRQLQTLQLSALNGGTGLSNGHVMTPTATTLNSVNKKVTLALSDDEETLPYKYSVCSGSGNLRLLAIPRWRLVNFLECVPEHSRNEIIHILCSGCVAKGTPPAVVAGVW